MPDVGAGWGSAEIPFHVVLLLNTPCPAQSLGMALGDAALCWGGCAPPGAAGVMLWAVGGLGCAMFVQSIGNPPGQGSAQGWGSADPCADLCTVMLTWRLPARVEGPGFGPLVLQGHPGVWSGCQGCQEGSGMPVFL